MAGPGPSVFGKWRAGFVQIKSPRSKTVIKLVVNMPVLYMKLPEFDAQSGS